MKEIFFDEFKFGGETYSYSVGHPLTKTLIIEMNHFELMYDIRSDIIDTLVFDFINEPLVSTQ